MQRENQKLRDEGKKIRTNQIRVGRIFVIKKDFVFIFI